MESPFVGCEIGRKMRQATLPFLVKVPSNGDFQPGQEKKPEISGIPLKDDESNDIEILSVDNDKKHGDQSVEKFIGGVKVLFPDVMNKGESNVSEHSTSEKNSEADNQNSTPTILIQIDDDSVSGETCGNMSDVKLKSSSSGSNYDVQEKNVKCKRKLGGEEKPGDENPFKKVKLLEEEDKIGNPAVEECNPKDESALAPDFKCSEEVNKKNSHETDCVDSKISDSKPESDVVVKAMQVECSDGHVNTANNMCNSQKGILEENHILLGNEICLTTDDEKKLLAKKQIKRVQPTPVRTKAELDEKKKKRKLLQEEKERQKMERKNEKVRLKQKKEEERKRIKQEKLERRKKLKEEKEKKRLVEIELKNEGKRKKEEERRKKDEQKLEEKRKKEEQKMEDKRKKEELQRKKEMEEELSKKKFTKEAEAFSNFFTKCEAKVAVSKEDDKSHGEIVFMPFTVKSDMRLAPVNRSTMDEERRSKFEDCQRSQCTVNTYLKEMRSGIIVPRKSGNTWPLEEKYDVVLVEGLDLNNENPTVRPKRFNDRRPKLLQFHENRRPPYWGTWRKRSRTIRPKNPFGKDEIFDYEVDSDDEWEEEEPGESLHGSDDEKESEDEYEVDNDFFVPHGYLSDDENGEEELVSPETQKAKLKLLGEQFDMERKEKTTLLKPITIGCVWFCSADDEPASVNPAVIKLLNKRKGVPRTGTLPISVLVEEDVDQNEGIASEGGTPNSVKKDAFPESAISELIVFIHGSTVSRKSLAKMFLSHWYKKENEMDNNGGTRVPLTQARVARKIKELGKWEEFPEEGPNYGKYCWFVKKDVRLKFGVGDAMAPFKLEEGSISKGPEGLKKVSPSLITKFTKILSEGERKNQLSSKCHARTSSNPKTPSDFVESSSVPHISSLKCAKKLQDFYAKPSLNAKYGCTSVPPISLDSEVVLTDSAGLESGKDSGVDNAVSECESTTKNALTGRIGQDDVELDPVSVNRAMDVTHGSRIATLDNELKDDADEVVLCASSVSLKRHESPSSLLAGSDGASEERHCRDLGAVDTPAAVVKKRVAILFSAPRGCEIVRTPVSPSAVTTSEKQLTKNSESV